jgi:hypothetical protein
VPIVVGRHKGEEPGCGELLAVRRLRRNLEYLAKHDRSAERLSMAMTPPPPHLGKYQRLHEYLRDRFANRVVLTFAEIEDLMGSSLPDAARSDVRWWEVPAAALASEHSNAWTFANRHAEVNFPAGRVVFDRDESLAAHRRPA